MSKESMRAMQICSAGLTDFRLSEQPIPRTGTHEILVRIRAASLNYRDLVVLKGIYKPNITFRSCPFRTPAAKWSKSVAM